MIKASVVPCKAVPISMKQGEKINKLAGQLQTSKMIALRNIKLPKFDKKCRIEGTKALIFENECKYDIIFGSDSITMIGMNIEYSSREIEWYNNTLPMRKPWDIKNKDYVQMCTSCHTQENDEFFGENWLDYYNIDRILDAKYDKLDIQEALLKQNHLNYSQTQDLKTC